MRGGPRRTLVAVSGVDGAGKSTLIGGLGDRLAAQGVSSDVVWFRPGMGMAWLDRPVRLLKRLLGQSTGPTVRTIARDTTVKPSSRRGVVGWLWCVLVTVTYVVTVRRELRGRSGVVLLDRHLADALVTLDVFYRGVNLALPRLLVRRLLPQAAATVYLEVPVDVAVGRKPGDTIEHHAVTAQLAAYPAYVHRLPRTVRVDATLPRPEVLDAAWAFVGPALHPVVDRTDPVS